MNAHQISIVINKVSEQCNLTNAQGLTSDSLRRGFATTPARQGASLAAIMQAITGINNYTSKLFNLRI